MFFLKPFRILFFVSCITTYGYSQTVDTLNKPVSAGEKIMTYAADKFAIARPFSIRHTKVSPIKFGTKTNNMRLPVNEITSWSQLDVSSNIPVLRRKKWILNANVSYRYLAAATDITMAGNVNTINRQRDIHYHYSTVNATYFSRLFNKPVIYTAGVGVDGSQKQLERLRGQATGTLVLKATAQTKMMVGLVTLIDPSSQTPVIPIFSFEQKLKNGWTVDLILPQRLLLKKNILDKSRISLGTELDRTSFYLYDIAGATSKYEFRQVDLNSGLTYEYLLGNFFILTTKTGLKYSPIARVFEKNKKFNDYTYALSPDPGFYFSVGISFNPFIKKPAKQPL